MNKKQNTVFISLIAIGVVIFAGYEGFGWKKYFNDFEEKVATAWETIEGKQDTRTTEEVTAEAWQVIEEYLGYAKAHDLEGVRKLSYKLSPTCENVSKIEECYALMDSVHAIISLFTKDNFNHALWNTKKITLFTDYKDGTRVALYFIRDNDHVLKINGMKFCFSNESTSDECSSLR